MNVSRQISRVKLPTIHWFVGPIRSRRAPPYRPNASLLVKPDKTKIGTGPITAPLLILAPLQRTPFPSAIRRGIFVASNPKISVSPVRRRHLPSTSSGTPLVKPGKTSRIRSPHFIQPKFGPSPSPSARNSCRTAHQITILLPAGRHSPFAYPGDVASGGARPPDFVLPRLR